MADTYNWNIANLERHLVDGAVYTAHWTINAERIVGQETYNTGAYGSIGFSDPDPKSFIPYTDLTKDTVVGWVKNALGKDKVTEMEAALTSQLDSQEHPKNASGIPWNNQISAIV